MEYAVICYTRQNNQDFLYVIKDIYEKHTSNSMPTGEN